MKQMHAARSLRFGLIALLAALATGCTLIDGRGKDEATVIGANVSTLSHPVQLGFWRGQLLVSNIWGSPYGIVAVDTSADTITSFFSLYIDDYPYFAITQESLLVAISSAGKLYIHNLVTHTSRMPQLPQYNVSSKLLGTNERLFISQGYNEGVREILEGSYVGARFGPSGFIGALAADSDRIFLGSGSSIFYRDNAGQSFDTLDMGSLLNDSSNLLSVHTIVAHGGYLFVKMFTYDETAPDGGRDYVAVLNAANLTLEKTFDLENSTYYDPPTPRIANGKWYLCGYNGNSPSQMALEVVDLNTRTYGGRIVFNEPISAFRDFVPTGPRQGYVIDLGDSQRIRKVTF